MWRSIVGRRRACLSRHAAAAAGLRFPSILQNPQLLPSFIPSPSPSPSPFPSLSHLSPSSTSSPLHQNPRFLSHHSSNLNDDDESPISQTIDNDASITTYRNSGFDEAPHIFVSSESEPSSYNNNYASLSQEPDLSLKTSNDDAQMEDSFVHEIDLEQLENVLSLLQSSCTSSSDHVSLETTLNNMNMDVFTLQQHFILPILQTQFIPADNLIGFFKWASTKPGFSVTVPIVDSLVRAVCSGSGSGLGLGLRKKDAYALWDLVKEIGQKESGVLTTEILNELISLFSKLGKGKAAFEVFNKFEELGCFPNAQTYYFTIQALCRRSIFDWASSVCEKMLSVGSLPDTEKIGSIISCLCKGSKAKDAHLVYLFAKENDEYPPKSSVNFLISSLCREDETVQLALEMLEDLSGEVRKYAIKPFSSVIRGLCRMKDVEGAKKLLFKMIDAGPPPGNAVFNSVINGLSKCGDMEEALEMMKLMESRGLKPDVYTYSVTISGYAKGGLMDEACKVLSEAKKKHSKLSPVTYHILIRGYCKLEEFDKALKLLSEMKDYGVQPNADEYNKLIQSLCLKALDWETAEKLLEEMKENGLYLNGITRGLISAVKELGEEGVETEEVVVQA